MTNSPLIKICGLKSTEMIDAAAEAQVELIGFVHFPKSPRYVDIDQLAELISYTRGRAQSVILLVNPDSSVVAECAALDPDYLQLHGSESADRVADVRAESGISIIKALPIGDADDVAQVAAYADVADMILLDAKPPKTATRPGGLGKKFDWTLLKALDPQLEFMLSGGLNPDNVAEAVAEVQPYAIDASSGLEVSPGVKDADLIRRFVENARAVS